MRARVVIAYTWRRAEHNALTVFYTRYVNEDSAVFNAKPEVASGITELASHHVAWQK